jgi:DNA-binding CsgD family transcriptional regulator
MPIAETLDLVGVIYDAALDPAVWPQALERVCGFVGGSMGNIFWQDVVAKAARRGFEWGNDPHYTHLYMETYAKISPLFPAAFAFPVGHVFRQSDVIPYEELHETRIYREWMLPQGYVDFIGCHLEKSAASCIPMTVIRHERDGLVGDESIERMKLVVPHVRRAALIGNVIGLRSCESASLSDMLDELAAGIFLVDATARIVHANTSGQEMLQRGTVVRKVSGRLTANTPEADQTLQDVFAVAKDGDQAVGRKGVVVPLQEPGGDRYVAHVLPLTSGARRRAGHAYASVAAVFVHKAGLEEPSAPDALAKAYKLTAMELRVLLGIVQVGGGTTIARELGISGATVRSHIQHIFEKTGTNRQADLVKLVAGFDGPLRYSQERREA